MAKTADRNADGLPDAWEKRYGLSLNRKQGTRDQDKDGLRNRDEYRIGTNPRFRDTDNDRLVDGDERPTGHDPLDPDSDGDGVLDGRESPGRIVRYRYGVVTIALSGGDRVRAIVNDDTDVSCVPPPPPAGGPAEDDGDVADGRVLARTEYDRTEPASTTDDGPTADTGGPVCGQDDLKAGAVIHAADLRLEDGVLVVRSIELLRVA